MDIPGHGESFFVAEVATRQIFPLSVFTLLTLVESGFYSDIHVMSDGNKGALLVGTTGQSNGGNLDEKLRTLGFLGGSTLYFPENSPQYPCGPNSLGFVDRGPALQLFLSSGVEGEHQSCFAEVVRGTETLHLIQEALNKGESIRLSSAAVLLANEDDGNNPDL